MTAGLEVRRDGPVGWLIFDRPERANALDAVMLDGLEAAWRAKAACAARSSRMPSRLRETHSVEK